MIPFFLSFRVKKMVYSSLLLMAFFIAINITLAQDSVSNSMSSINLNVSPSNPRPGDSVVLTLSSDFLNLNSSKIVWYIDGVARPETSSDSITIKAKNTGENTTVRVVVQTADGIIKETSSEISTSGVDLVIEPMAYTLPFYKGKPFFLAEGVVKIIAIPDIRVGGVEIPVKDLNFKWTNGEVVLGDSSGKGKNLIVINSSIPVRDLIVNVQVLDDFGNVLAENSKIITKNNPQVLFYENSPLYGILYNKAVTGNYYLGTKEELDIVAKPFSFSFSSDAPVESNYMWYINGNSIVPSGKKNELILRQATSSISGVASISLDINNKNKINQYISGRFNVQFGQ